MNSAFPLYRFSLHFILIAGLAPLLAGLGVVIAILIEEHVLGLTGHTPNDVAIPLVFILAFWLGWSVSFSAAALLTLLALWRQSYGYLSAFLVGMLALSVALQLGIIPLYTTLDFLGATIAALAAGAAVALSRLVIGWLCILPFDRSTASPNQDSGPSPEMKQ